MEKFRCCLSSRRSFYPLPGVRGGERWREAAGRLSSIGGRAIIGDRSTSHDSTKTIRTSAKLRERGGGQAGSCGNLPHKEFGESRVVEEVEL